MDKYEYQVCADQIKADVAEGKFAEAMEIADRIDWRKVKSVHMLCTVSEVYKINKKYEESLEILLLAYDRHPDGKTIIYALCELAIKMNDVVAAVEYYKQYMRVAPEDTSSYILLYKIYEAQDVTLEERIQVLEEFKKRDYREKWAYELAYLYHRVGQESKCVAECDELILWFGEGKYVRKAMELKMEHADLTPEQRRKYEGVTSQQVVEAYGQPIQEAYQGGQLPGQQDYDNYNPNPYEQNGYIPYENQAYGQQPYEQPVYEQPVYEQGIQIQPVNVNTDKYSTMNLQEELARNMQEFMANTQPDLQAQYYGHTAELYEPAQTGEIYGNAYANAYENSYMQQSDMSQRMQEGFDAPQEYAYQQEYPETFEEQSLPVVPEVPAPKKELDTISINKKYDSILAQEYDGQISLSLPDVDMVEKQITGQLNLDDILNGWEEKQQQRENKRENKPGKKADKKPEERRISLQETSDIMSKLEGVIPGVGTEVVYPSAQPTAPMPTATGAVYGTMPSGRVLTLDEEYGGNLAKIREEEAALAAGQEPETATPAEYTEAPVEDFVEATAETPIETPIEETLEAPVEESVEAEVSDESPVETAIEDQVETIAPEEPIEETIEDENPEYINSEEVTEEASAAQADFDFPEITFDLDPEEVVREIAPIVDAEEEESEPAEVSSEEVEEVAEPEEEPALAPSNEVPPVIPDYSFLENSSVHPFMQEDYGEVEEIEDIDQPEDLDDMLKTSNMPIEEIERLAQQRYEAGLEAEEAQATEDESTRRNHPSYMTLEEAVKSRRDFSEEEERIFGRYDGIEPLKAQIVDVMDSLSMDPKHGNVVVLGSDECGRNSLALDIVKAIQSRDQIFSGKVAKISGEALNKKNIPITIKKLRKGALIVENAGGLTQESMHIIADSLLQETEPVLVVLEGTKNSMEPLLNGNRMVNAVFDARVDIAPFTNDDLVAYGKGYAREQEYSIDEMGILALYTRIGEMQTLDHVVSIDEVRDIIDAAIKHVDRKNMSHFMDVLLAKRYDDDDYIVLREKDFIN